MYSTVETDVLHCSTRKPLLPRAGNPHVSQPEPSWSSETGGGWGWNGSQELDIWRALENLCRQAAKALEQHGFRRARPFTSKIIGPPPHRILFFFLTLTRKQCGRKKKKGHYRGFGPGLLTELLLLPKQPSGRG